MARSFCRWIVDATTSHEKCSIFLTSSTLIINPRGKNYWLLNLHIINWVVELLGFHDLTHGNVTHGRSVIDSRRDAMKKLMILAVVTGMTISSVGCAGHCGVRRWWNQVFYRGDNCGPACSYDGSAAIYGDEVIASGTPSTTPYLDGSGPIETTPIN